MVLFQVDKVVVVTLVDAAKTTLEQVSALRMEQAERGVEDARHLVSLYGDLRRLKDYLQRCVGAFRDQVELDLAEEDLPLLTACCRRGAEVTDQRLSSCTDGRERTLLQNRRDLLLDWAVELATEPLLELPLPGVAPSLSPAMRGLRMRISQKFAREKLHTTGYDQIGQMPPLDGPLGGLDTPIAPAPSRLQLPSFDPEPLPHSQPHTLPPMSPTLRAREPQLQADPEPAANVGLESPSGPEPDAPRLLAVGSIRDPRLRAMMALDLRALDRATAANDYRLAAVHLTSVLEGAVIDHALTRTMDLGLSGTPDTWNPQEVLLRIFGDQCAPRDRAAAYHVFAARSLMRPALQLKTPLVVTAVTYRKHVEFVAHALRTMGYTA
ncbi:MAG: hypothetical protein AB7O97_02250 [Planctomycetota bacterium]